MEEADSEEPRYRSSDRSAPSPSGSLQNRDDIRDGVLDSEDRPTLVGDPDLIE